MTDPGGGDYGRRGRASVVTGTRPERPGGVRSPAPRGAGRELSGGSQQDHEERHEAPRTTHPLLITLAVAGSLHLFFLLAVELDRNLVHRREVARLRSEVTALAAELSGLEAVAAHGDDLAYREVLARKQGFVYPDEALVVTRRE